jgi:prepilin-type N-terminal cleavage/methylation domain-containing protein/prepilin-type processing-associated H-X9-DG protein
MANLGTIREKAAPRKGSRRGFTLIELLVVIAIIGTLIGLLLPAVQSAREAGRRSSCANNIKQLITAIFSYETANSSFPPGRVGCDNYSGAPCVGMQGTQTPGTSGFLLLLPQLDNTPLYSALTPLSNGAVYPASANGTSTWKTTTNNAGTTIATGLAAPRPPVFACPTDRTQPTNPLLNPITGTSSYAMVLGSWGAGNSGSPASGTASTSPADEPHQKYYNNGPFIYYTAHRASDVRDGLSSTFFIGETIDGDNPGSLNCWPLAVAYLSTLRATDNPLNGLGGNLVAQKISNSGLSGIDNLPNVYGAFASYHPGGANFGYGGGNVRFIGSTIDINLYRALSTINLNEPIPTEY